MASLPVVRALGERTSGGLAGSCGRGPLAGGGVDPETGTLYGTPDEISAKLQALRDVGAEYVLLNSPGGLPSLRRFAQEILPAFAGAPLLRTAV